MLANLRTKQHFAIMLRVRVIDIPLSEGRRRPLFRRRDLRRRRTLQRAQPPSTNTLNGKDKNFLEFLCFFKGKDDLRDSSSDYKLRDLRGVGDKP